MSCLKRISCLTNEDMYDQEFDKVKLKNVIGQWLHFGELQNAKFGLRIKIFTEK